jgi:hypothetical protein
MESAAVRDTLDRLLNANAGYSLAARGTTNHCPMVLVALARMGATPQRLQTHFDYWVEKYAIPEASPRIAIGAENWSAFTGVPQAFGSLQACFAEWMIADGPNAVIEAVLRQAPLAPATDAFHAIIRIAYGIEQAHASEIAAGLASYVAASLPCRVDFAGREALASPEEGFEVLSDRFANAVWPGRSITDKLKAVAATRDFGESLRLPPVGPEFIVAMARAAIRLYWQTADFTVLHMVTGSHAARILLAHLPKDLADRFYPALWAAMAAAYVSVGAPPEQIAARAGALLEWPELMARAIASYDDHVIKMVYTCHCEDLRDPNPLYRAAATRLLTRRDQA